MKTRSIAGMIRQVKSFKRTACGADEGALQQAQKDRNVQDPVKIV
jgi:hypothetical protein